MGLDECLKLQIHPGALFERNTVIGTFVQFRRAVVGIEEINSEIRYWKCSRFSSPRSASYDIELRRHLPAKIPFGGRQHVLGQLARGPFASGVDQPTPLGFLYIGMDSLARTLKQPSLKFQQGVKLPSRGWRSLQFACRGHSGSLQSNTISIEALRWY
jgi:hypothetical protein